MNLESFVERSIKTKSETFDFLTNHGIGEDDAENTAIVQSMRVFLGCLDGCNYYDNDATVRVEDMLESIELILNWSPFVKNLGDKHG